MKDFADIGRAILERRPCLCPCHGERQYFKCIGCYQIDSVTGERTARGVCERAEEAVIEVGALVALVDHAHSLSCIDCPRNAPDAGVMPRATKAIRTILPGSSEPVFYACCSSACYARLMVNAKVLFEECSVESCRNYATEVLSAGAAQILGLPGGAPICHGCLNPSVG